MSEQADQQLLARSNLFCRSGKDGTTERSMEVTMNAKRFIIIALVAMTMVLSACSLTANPTPDPAAVQAAASTLVAQTAQANQPTASPTPFKPVPSTPTASPTSFRPTLTPIVDGVFDQATATLAPAQSGATTSFDNVASFRVTGAPRRVDVANILRATGPDAYGSVFNNVTGLGSEMMLADKGSILYGSDEPAEIVLNNPSGAYLSGDNQHFLGTETWSDNVAEGAFQYATGASMTIQVREFTIRVESTGTMCSNNWHVFIRGLFKDGKQDSDRNSTSHYSNYVAGHTEILDLPVGAYISEGWRNQNAEASHKDFRNCGAEGTSGLSELYLDLNTGAWLVLYQPNLNQPWRFVASNWR